MMNERDKRVVENFINTGMNLDSVCASFPTFEKWEIEELYYAYHSKEHHNGEELQIKVNCS